MPLWLTQIAPFSAIVGAIIGASAAAFVTLRFVVKRQAVTFFISEPVDIIEELRSQKIPYILDIGGAPVNSLTRTEIIFRNSGNKSIDNLTFLIRTTPAIGRMFVQPQLNDKVCQTAIIPMAITEADQSLCQQITIPFLNPGERGTLIALVDGEGSPIQYECRMPDLVVKSGAVASGAEISKLALSVLVTFMKEVLRI